jgi:hypothetical protein
MANKAVGKVRLISVQDDATLIMLDMDTTNGPLDGIFRLLPSDKNYNARYTMALTAAVNRLVLFIRSAGELNPAEPAGIRFMQIDWGDEPDDLD